MDNYQASDYQQSNERMPCGQWCAKFGEPKTSTSFMDNALSGTLDLCEKTLHFSEFTDERGVE